MASGNKISSLLRPASIAIVGATQDPTKIVGALMMSLISCGYRGKVFPVNPRRSEINGLPCYPSISEVPEAVDHCIVALPQEHVLGVIKECRAKGVKSATILTAGYAELGEAGVAAQAELKEAAGDMVFIGPNCIGFANLVDRVVCTSSATMRHDSRPGDIAVISQSGGLATSSFAFFGQQAGFRFSHLVTTGNSAGISYADLVDFLFDDPATRIIVAIIEDERTLGQVIEVVRRRGLEKPIVLMKCGRGQTGTRMAQSHTGSLAGDYAVARDCSQQFGIICADDVEDAIGIVSLLRAGMSPSDAEGLCATSHSGGNLTLFADAVDDEELRFAELSEDTKGRLRELLPDYVSIQNPVDVTTFGVRDYAAYGSALDALLDDGAISAIVVIITVAADNTPIRDLIVGIKQRRPKGRLIVLWNGGAYGGDDGDAALMREAGVPVFYSARTLVRSLDRLRRAKASGKPEGADVQSVPKLPAGQQTLTESDSLRFLAEGGLRTPKIAVCERRDLAKTADTVGYPIVIKSDVVETHLSDRGGVILDIRNSDDLARLTDKIAAMPGERLIVSQFLPGHELVASTFHHPAFGPILMLGSGGLLVELLKDVRFCALPVTRDRLTTCLGQTLIGHALQSGFRGAQGFEAALDFLSSLGALALSAQGTVSQIEVNPITVGAHGAAAVDATVIPLSH